MGGCNSNILMSEVAAVTVLTKRCTPEIVHLTDSCKGDAVSILNKEIHKKSISDQALLLPRVQTNGMDRSFLHCSIRMWH